MVEPNRAEKSPKVRSSESGGQEKLTLCSGKLAASPASVKSAALAAFYACNRWPKYLGRVWLRSTWTKGGAW